MILGFKQQFADGTPTDFERKILTGEKIHSIRAGERWYAGMSIQMAFGVRTKNYRQFNKGIDNLSTALHVQKVFMTYAGHGLPDIVIGMLNYLTPAETLKLIANDGLTKEQFIAWFFPGGKGNLKGQVIHWTDFKY